MEGQISYSTHKFSLNPDCFLVKGSKRGAIYNLSTGDVYSVDENSVEVLSKCEEDLSLSMIIETVPKITLNEILNYFQKLSDLGLGKFLNTDQVVKKIPLRHPEVKLDFLWLELTRSCNQRCFHCYADSSPYSVVKNSLSLEDWKRVIKEGNQMGCRRLQFTGGEPLLFGKEIFTLIKTARDVGYEQVEIFTNATLFTKEDVDLLVKYDVKVAANIYSKRPEIHDQITGLKGSFENTIRNIKLLMEKGVKVYLATILMQQNEAFREETVAFLQELGEPMPLKHYDIVRPAGRGENSDILSDNLVLMSYKSSPIFSKITKDKFIVRKYGHSCWWGKIVVTCEGKVMPCIMAGDKTYGNVKQQPLYDIIQETSLLNLWKLSKDKIEICRDCEYRYICLDCRPLAMGEEGGLYRRWEYCLYDPYQGKWQETPKKGGKTNARSKKGDA